MTDRPVMLIAGGSGSIGQATACEALAQGWTVALHGRTPEKLAALMAELGALGPVETFEADVFAADCAPQLVAAVAERWGRIDAVVDCVASGVPGITGLFQDTDPAAFTPFYDVTTGWLLRLSHAAYPHLKVRGGTIISFIADAGIFAAPHQTGTGPARAACVGFIRNLSREAACDRIRANVISVSYVEGSDMVQRLSAKRMETARRRAGLGLPCPVDIAPMTVFLCGPGAAKITGQVISINGGLNA
ncbi:MAG: SDR family oxidoreductase [Alphaproteobacteria bacterium]|nr:SDR family oxidoreductase [Alphaproteobacteria bacterium]